MILQNHFSFFNNNNNNNSSNTTKNISTRILHKLKKLALSSEKYKSFMDLSTNSDERTIHHLPKINSLRHSESQKSLDKKNVPILENIVLPYKNISIRNKRVQPFFISELNGIKNKEKKIELKKINLVKLKKIIKFPETNKFIYKRNNINLFPSFRKRIKEKQIFFLLSSIFSDKNDEDNKEIKLNSLKYEEEKIFGYKDKYVDF